MIQQSHFFTINRTRILTFVLTLTVLPFKICTSSVNAEEIKCHSEQSIKGGGTRTADLKLILEKNQIVGLIFSGIVSFVEKGNPMAIWLCSVDTTNPEKDHEIKWTRKSSITVLEITEKDTDENSIVKIVKLKNGYKIHFVEMSCYFSGNSEFPKSVLISNGNKQCTALYNNKAFP
jgi:hypothetical protein